MPAWLETPYKPLPVLDPNGGWLTSLMCVECLMLVAFSPVPGTVSTATVFALTQGGDEQIAPFSIAYVKGWRRALACLICCEGVRSLGLSPDELTSDFKALCFNAG